MNTAAAWFLSWLERVPASRAAVLALLERMPAPRLPRLRAPRLRVRARTRPEGPVPGIPAPGTGPLHRESRLAAIPVAGLIAPNPGGHVLPRGWDKDPVRVTPRGDTGEIEKVYDPDKPFPMARRYAREAGYR